MPIRLIALLAAAILAVMFALQNAVPVTVTFFLWRVDASLALVLIVCLAAGALLSAFATLPSLMQKRFQLRRQQRRIAELEAQLSGRPLESAQVAGETVLPPAEELEDMAKSRSNQPL
jgi:putative membrane protein